MTPGLTLSYLARLMCFSLSAGLAAYLTGALVSAALAPLALRWLATARSRLRDPAHAAAGLLGLRLLPLLLSGLAIGGLCVPSYIWLEPHHSAEQVSLGFCVASLAGALLMGMMLWRLARVGMSSWRYARQCRIAGENCALRNESSPVLVLSDSAPLMALAGIVRPRLLVSRSIVQRLSPEQLEAGLRHERAHQHARDNLKRLLLIAAPTLLPTAHLHALDHAWSRLAEWAADDRSVASAGGGSDSHRALALASALVAVARMGPSPLRSPRGCAAQTISYLSPTSLTADGADLADRVQRLLTASPCRSLRVPARLTRITVWLASALLLALMLHPATLIAVHNILEHLVH